MARAESCEALTEAGGGSGRITDGYWQGLSPLQPFPGIPVPHEIEVSLGLLECPHDIVCGSPRRSGARKRKKNKSHMALHVLISEVTFSHSQRENQVSEFYLLSKVMSMNLWTYLKISGGNKCQIIHYFYLISGS